MKIKDGFILRQVASQNVVLPASKELNLNMMITLNDTGAFLWKHLQTETSEEALVETLLGEYDVDADTARNCVRQFVKKLEDNGFLV